MIRFRKSTVGAATALAALMLLPAPGFASGEHHLVRGEAPAASAPAGTRLAHMGRGLAGGPGQGYGPGPHQGYGAAYGMGSGMMGAGMMGSGMMGSGMMGPGQGYGMGPGMMGSGQGYGMVPGMMPPGYGYGPQPGYGMGPAIDQGEDLSVDDVRDRIERNLAWHGNERLMVGEVTEADEDTVIADIVTKDGSLVRRFRIDRHTGQMRDVE